MDALKMYGNMFLTGILLAAPPPQDLPPEPAIALKTLAGWLLLIMMGVLAVTFAFAAFRTGRKTQQQVSDDFEQGQPVGESLKKYGRWFLVLALLVGTFLLPPLIFGREASILGLLEFLLDWILTNLLPFLG